MKRLKDKIKRDIVAFCRPDFINAPRVKNIEIFNFNGVTYQHATAIAVEIYTCPFTRRKIVNEYSIFYEGEKYITKTLNNPA